MEEYNAALREYNLIRQRMEQRREYFTVVFCGVFSSGKTSLINRLLDYADFRLPTGINPVTKLNTRIRYGERLSFSCLINGNKIPVSQNDFVDMVKGNNVPVGIDEIEILIPSVILKNKIEFIDTPGFLDEMGGELEKMSRKAVAGADLAVFCANALQLGDMFEKEFIAELEETVGSFIMVVNRMDNLHEEEIAPVREKAGYLMKGRGGRLVTQTLGTNVFFSSANGKYIDLGGFDGGICHILGSGELRDAVTADTGRVNAHWRICRLREQAEWELENLHYALASLQNGHQTELTKIELANSLRSMEAGAKKRRLLSRFMTELDRCTETAVSRITSLYETGQSGGFAENVTYILKTEYYQTARMLDDTVSGSVSAVDGFNYAIHRLAVPAPVGQRVKRRGVIQRMQNDIKAAKDRGASVIKDKELRDDGYDTVYNEYHIPAINAVRKKLLPELQNIVDKKMNEYQENLASHISAQSGYENRIMSTEAQIEKWMNIIGALNKLDSRN